MTGTTAQELFADFPDTFKGPIIRPGDPEYDGVKTIWSTRRDHQRPALIVRATDAADVKAAVDFANDKNVSVAVRGGGHGIDCFAMPHDALVVDMSLMKAISIDPSTGRTSAQAGVLLSELNTATQEHGYAVPAGTVSGVGVAGLTLGGGFGHLTRRFGATIDNLLSVDVVTTDGRILTASHDENADLFWGMRGAGQNLAIATNFTFQAQRVGPVVISGYQLFGPSDAHEFLSGLHGAMSKAPRELSISPIVRLAPPLPGVPPEMVGKPIVLAVVVFSGPEAEFDAAMESFRSLPTPILDTVGPATWLATTSALDSFLPGGRRWYNGGGYLSVLTSDIAQKTLDFIAISPPDCEAHFPICLGALHDFAENSAAFSREGVGWLVEITGQWDSPDEDPLYIGWLDDSLANLKPHLLPNGSINLNQYHGTETVKAIYGSDEKWHRIVALKQRWDPHNRLSYNKNIPPA